jgi:hypothetical protein
MKGKSVGARKKAPAADGGQMKCKKAVKGPRYSNKRRSATWRLPVGTDVDKRRCQNHADCPNNSSVLHPSHCRGTNPSLSPLNFIVGYNTGGLDVWNWCRLPYGTIPLIYTKRWQFSLGFTNPFLLIFYATLISDFKQCFQLQTGLHGMSAPNVCCIVFCNSNASCNDNG